MSEDRTYPQRPILAVSAAIIHEDRVLIVRRAKPPLLFTLPGGVVEAGETLHAAIQREVMEETSLAIEPVALAGHREVIGRDPDGRVKRHFVIMAFACRWTGGELALSDEVAEAQWLAPDKIAGLETTEGLAEIVAAAFDIFKAPR